MKNSMLISPLEQDLIKKIRTNKEFDPRKRFKKALNISIDPKQPNKPAKFKFGLSVSQFPVLLPNSDGKKKVSLLFKLPNEHKTFWLMHFVHIAVTEGRYLAELEALMGSAKDRSREGGETLCYEFNSLDATRFFGHLIPADFAPSTPQESCLEPKPEPVALLGLVEPDKSFDDIIVELQSRLAGVNLSQTDRTAAFRKLHEFSLIVSGAETSASLPLSA